MSDLREDPVADFAQTHRTAERFAGPFGLLDGEPVEFRRCLWCEQPDLTTPGHQVAIASQMLDWLLARAPVHRGVTQLEA